MIGAIIIGAIVGCIAGKIMGSHHGIVMNAIIGVLGSSVGHFLFNLVGFSAQGLASLMVDIIGACIVIAMARKIG